MATFGKDAGLVASRDRIGREQVVVHNGSRVADARGCSPAAPRRVVVHPDHSVPSRDALPALDVGGVDVGDALDVTAVDSQWNEPPFARILA